MSPRRLVNSALAVALLGIASPLACAAASKPAAPVVAEPTPAPAPPSSASAASSVAASASASTASAPVAAAPEATAAAPPSSSEPAPPCVDGEVLMGTCICTDKGKTPDATGHCVYPPCPKSTSGGTAFRDETTGQCFECRAGTRPTKDGRCER